MSRLGPAHYVKIGAGGLWTALAFILIIAGHVLLHWGYIKANLKKYRK